MQMAYERGYRDALDAATGLCKELSNSTAPQRRLAGQDLAEALHKLQRA